MVDEFAVRAPVEVVPGSSPDPDQYRDAFPAFRIFVFGQEITERVISNNIVNNDGRAPNTAEIVLLNEFDEFVMTESDILAIYRDIDATNLRFPGRRDWLAADDRLTVFGANNPINTSAPLTSRKSVPTLVSKVDQSPDHVLQQVIDRVNREVFPKTKREIVAAKVPRAVRGSQASWDSPTQANSLRSIAALTGSFMTYPFQVGDAIFHSNDPVRIFWRDPYNPSVWYHMFCGFVTDTVDTVDENNTRLLTLRCEDPTRILRYARVATNPGLIDIDAVNQAEDESFRSFFGEAFQGLSIIELMYTFIFGDRAAGTTQQINQNISDVHGTTGRSIHFNGAGRFNFDGSVNYIFGSPGPAPAPSDRAAIASADLQAKDQNIQSLAEYQNFIDHKVKDTDLINMFDYSLTGQVPPVTSPKYDEFGNPDANSIIDAIGPHPNLYPVDGGKLIMLLPKSLGPHTNSKILLKDIINDVSMTTTYKTRLGIIYDMLAKIEFSFYASPKGDLMCEMPLYDFQPDDFGDSSQAAVSKAADGRQAGPPTVAEAGPFAQRYVVPRRDTISWERTFSDEHVRTQFKTGWALIQNLTDAGLSTDLMAPVVITLKALVPLFGVRQEQAEPRSYVANAEAARLYNHLKLNQWNADARSAHVSMMPRVQGWVNRPYEFVERMFIGTSRSVKHSLSWNADMSTEIDVNYIRGWAGQVDHSVDPPRPVYEPLGGFASRPLNYAVLFGLETPAESTKSGPGDLAE